MVSVICASLPYVLSLFYNFSRILSSYDNVETFGARFSPKFCSGKAVLPGDKVYQHSEAAVVSRAVAPPLNVTPLFQSGPAENRIDLTFFSDGYLASEYDKFIADATRLAQDVSGNQTFNTVKPLLNFWAAFTPSNESGVGVGGKPKDTPFGLYRDGTELRGVYYENPEVAQAACDSLGTRCDFPVLLGNDGLYGGLGGDFTVITASVLNGPLVLRHELGHSIIDVGEEYDGAETYFGANHLDNTSEPISWSHWLTDPKNPRVEKSAMPFQAYTWTLLNTSSSWNTKFTTTGSYPRNMLSFSLAGLPSTDDLTVKLDGIDVDWSPRPDIGIDRWFYDICSDTPLEQGEHSVEFILNNKEREGEAQLCSLEVQEYGDESQFVSEPGHYSLYNTFPSNGDIYYRPTNDDCLMRTVTKPNFCKVCAEALWLALLKRVKLIDNLAVSSCSATTHKTLSLSLVPVGQFRNPAIDGYKEAYDIEWTKDGKAVNSWKGQVNVTIPVSTKGTFEVAVKYTTQEVKVDKEGLLMAKKSLQVQSGC